MTADAKRYAITTPDGYTVRATTCRAIIECMDPEGGVQITGALLPVGGSLTYAHLDSTATLSPNGLRAVADVLLGVASDTAQDAPGCPQNDQQSKPGQLDGGGATEAAERQYGHGGMVLSAADYHELAHRAEKAEAERDAMHRIFTTIRDYARINCGGKMLNPERVNDILKQEPELYHRHPPEG